MVKHAHSRRVGSLRLARTGSDEKDDEDVKGEDRQSREKKGERKSQEGNGKDLEEVATNLEQEGRGGTETEMTK